MKKHEIVFEFQKAMTPLTAEGVVSDMATPVLIGLVSDALDQYSASIVATLNLRIQDWEKKELEDPTLYSLGLRHAVDVILEDDPYERAAILAKQYERELNAQED